MRWLGVQLGLVDEVEEPHEALDLAYARRVELLTKARRGVAEVVAARKRIELQVRQARSAPAAELAELERRTALLTADEARLREASRRLELQLQQLRLRREALRAGGAAARALEATPPRSKAEVADELARVEEELLWGPKARKEREREQRG